MSDHTIVIIWVVKIFFVQFFCVWMWELDCEEGWARSNQSILKEINPGISLEGMMLKLKLQYFSHLMQRLDSLEKTLMLGGVGGRRRRGRPRMRWLDGITESMNVSEWTLGVGDGQGSLACCDSWGHKESDKTEWLNWTEYCTSQELFFFDLLLHICLSLKNIFIYILFPYIFPFIYSYNIITAHMYH